MEAFVVLSKSETQDSEYYGSSKTMLLWIMQAYYDFQQQKIEDRTKFFVCLLPISGVKWKWFCILMGPESTRIETIKGFCAYLHFQGTFYIKHVGHYSYRGNYVLCNVISVSIGIHCYFHLGLNFSKVSI